MTSQLLLSAEAANMSASLKRVTLSFGEQQVIFRVDESTAEKLQTDAVFLRAYVQRLLDEGLISGLNLNEGNEEDGATTGKKESSPTKTSQASNYHWSKPCTRLLIAERRKFSDELADPKCKKKGVWSKIADSMAEKGYLISAEDCDKKFRNLTLTYRKNKHRKNKSSVVVWEFFDDMDKVLGEAANVDVKEREESPSESEIVRLRLTLLPSPTSTPSSDVTTDVKPTPSLQRQLSQSPRPQRPSQSLEAPQTSCTVTQLVSNWSEMSPPNTPEADASVSDSKAVPKKKRKVAEDEQSTEVIPKWFVEYMEKKEEMDRKRWEDMKALEERKISALLELVMVLKQKHNVPHKWDKDATRLLIAERAKFDSDFENNPRGVKKKIWEKIAENMGEKGYKVTGDECDMKFRNLGLAYRKHRGRKMVGGEVRIDWDFYEDMDKLLGHKMSSEVHNDN